LHVSCYNKDLCPICMESLELRERLRAHIRSLKRDRVSPVVHVYRERGMSQLATVVQEIQADVRKARATCDAIGVPYVASIR